MPTKKDNRPRNFATVVYPESAPEDWLDILGEWKIPTFVSPLHDRDVNPTGELKKEHYHIMVMFEGKKSYEQVEEIFSSIGGVGCEQVQSIRGYARYLCHLDNPEKAQYSMDDIKQFGGADYHSIIDLATDKHRCIKEMIEFCKENGIISYSQLMDYAMEFRYDWFRVLCDSGSIVMREYLKSHHWLIQWYEEQRQSMNERRRNEE